MSKKLKIQNNKIFNIIAIVLALISIGMIFAEVCGINADGKVGYVLTGIQATFGYSKESTVLGSTIVTTFTNLSFMSLLMYALLIVGVVLIVLRTFKIIKANSIDWISALMFITAGVLYFLLPNFVAYGEGWIDLVNFAIKAGGTKVVLFGSIVGGLTAILAGASIIVSKCLKK